ncbi:hypothetical protein M011DRAFT_132915 [Sporormia fimetaria CBS 119925]|uniref:Uncharacterized protein n=1 Tax=Sporormia fimetaria CBS 119925 TaxID=1340428 RepID=A0A6A6V5G0_9PLEO|nr:hypothetical protein M011DRAFT_132915 [Sporormia fimetaria CBS 119925]
MLCRRLGETTSFWAQVRHGQLSIPRSHPPPSPLPPQCPPITPCLYPSTNQILSPAQPHPQHSSLLLAPQLVPQQGRKEHNMRHLPYPRAFPSRPPGGFSPFPHPAPTILQHQNQVPQALWGQESTPFAANCWNGEYWPPDGGV